MQFSRLFSILFLLACVVFASAKLEKRRNLVPQLLDSRGSFQLEKRALGGLLPGGGSTTSADGSSATPTQSSGNGGNDGGNSASQTSQQAETTPATTQAPATTSAPSSKTQAPSTTLPKSSSAVSSSVPSVQITYSTSYYTPSPTALPSASPTASAAADSGSGPSPVGRSVIIVIAVVGGVFVMAFLSFQVYRKWRLAPSSRFEEKLQPIDFAPRHHQSDTVFFRELNEP